MQGNGIECHKGSRMTNGRTRYPNSARRPRALTAGHPGSPDGRRLCPGKGSGPGDVSSPAGARAGSGAGTWPGGGAQSFKLLRA